MRFDGSVASLASIRRNNFHKEIMIAIFQLLYHNQKDISKVKTDDIES